MVYNIWKSLYTGEIYTLPVSFVPKYGGWELVRTIIVAED